LNFVSTGWWFVMHLGLEHFAMPIISSGTEITLFSTTSKEILKRPVYFSKSQSKDANES
jgi:hypothetical protein